MKKILQFTYLAVLACLIMSCAESEQIGDGEQIVDSEIAAKVRQSKDLIPVQDAEVATPGTLISFSHDYDGESDPNVRDDFLLKVRKPPWGEMTLVFSTSSGLSLLTESQMRFDGSEAVLDIPVEFLAENAGSYRMNVVASVTSEDTPMRAVEAYAIKIEAGSIGVVSESPAFLIRESEEEPVVIRSAKETIE